MKIKICGMRDPDNISQVSGCSPDYMGFIFYEKSLRYVGRSFSEIKLSKFGNGVKKVGVFVNSDLEYVFDKVSQLNLDLLQLHGDESAEYCAKIKAKGILVIKAIQIATSADLNIASGYGNVVDYFLFDTKGSSYGGSGKKFNWDILSHYHLDVPFFLSGGIQSNDLEKLISISKNIPIHAVDVNSGFEIEPGLKDIELVKKAIKKLN